MFASLGCLLISLLFAVICAYIARNQGRSVPLAFAMGFIFSIFAFVGYLIIGDDHVVLATRRHYSLNDEVEDVKDKVALLPGKGVKVLKKATKKAKKKIENKF